MSKQVWRLWIRGVVCLAITFDIISGLQEKVTAVEELSRLHLIKEQSIIIMTTGRAVAAADRNCGPVSRANQRTTN